MTQNGQAEKGATDYGREALSQWADAARYGLRALAARREASQEGPGLRERLDPTKTDKGGKVGDVADAALAKLGRPGRLAAKVHLGSRLVERTIGGSSEDGSGDDRGAAEVPAAAADAAVDEEGGGLAAGDGVGAGAPLPIQGAIDVALPVAAVFDLCTRFDELPQIVDRVDAVEVEDDTHFTVLARAGKRQHELEIELVGEEADERLDWECVGELEHSGVLTFHPLAPRLTRLELTIERDSEGAVEHVGRLLGLPERALKQELRRFKAVAELWEDGKGYEPAEIALAPSDEEPEEEVEGEDELADEEPLEGDEQEPEAAER